MHEVDGCPLWVAEQQSLGNVAEFSCASLAQDAQAFRNGNAPRHGIDLRTQAERPVHLFHGGTVREILEPHGQQQGPRKGNDEPASSVDPVARMQPGSACQGLYRSKPVFGKRGQRDRGHRLAAARDQVNDHLGWKDEQEEKMKMKRKPKIQITYALLQGGVVKS